MLFCLQANQENVQVTLPTFKARPATVLYKKPFEPKLGPKPLTEITEFQLNTDKRAKEREAFEEDMKKREERIEQFKKQVSIFQGNFAQKLALTTHLLNQKSFFNSTIVVKKCISSSKYHHQKCEYII